MKALPWIHALTGFTGAFLLFQVQPLLSKRILPAYGGGSEVWTTCLLFFQCALFAGYLYAWLSERLLPPVIRGLVHFGLVAAAVVFVAQPVPVESAGAGDPSGQILKWMAMRIGAPYVLLASTGPLVQAWFARTCPERSPFRLYALSNAGSLLALLTFPLVAEPRWGLDELSTFWSWGFFAFAGLTLAGLISAFREAPVEPACDVPPSAGRRILWVLLPAFACAMLVSTTEQLCQDLVVVPFLWVMPLAVYLVSFILAFDHPRWFRPAEFSAATAALVFVSATFYAVRPASPALFFLGQAATLAMLFSVCMLCHGLLAWLKPGVERLASYYVAIAGGGALGGTAVGLVAPRLFSTYLEWKLGMAAAYVLGCGLLAWNFRGFLRAHLNLAALGLVVVGTGLAFLSAFFGTYGKELETVRNFHGKVTVRDSTDGTAREMIHGRVLHGRQPLDPRLRLQPTVYYVPESGVGRAMLRFQDREDFRAGVVGLGVGTLAAWGSRPTQSIRFYEINPEVERLARTRFTYLADCRARVEVAIGDARRLLEREPFRHFHVLAVDAFSGNAVPTHLLTVEAMALYARHLDPEGVVAVHVSNRHLDLAPVVRASARRSGLRTVEVEWRTDEGGSTWVLCTRSEAAVRDFLASGARPGDGREVEWTDDRSDLFSVLRFR
jgi:hypothetical protein